MSTDDIYPPEIGKRLLHDDDHVTDTRVEARELFVRRALIFISVGVVLAVLGITAFTAVAIRNQQVDRAPVTDGIAEQTAVIKDCTEPGGKCYDRSQRQLRSTIQELNQFGAVVAACASGSDPVSYDEIIVCATEQIRRLTAPGRPG